MHEVPRFVRAGVGGGGGCRGGGCHGSRSVVVDIVVVVETCVCQRLCPRRQLCFEVSASELNV